MGTMRFLIGETIVEVTAEEFCKKFALVIDQNADPEDRVAVKLLHRVGIYEVGKEYCLDEAEQKSVFDTLGITVTIPVIAKQKKNKTVILIHGGVNGSNIYQGNGNTVEHVCHNGISLTTIVSGSGIVIDNK